MAFRATFTRDGHKKLAKNRKWLDGFITLQAGGGIKLLEEGGSVAAVGRVLPGEPVEEGSELVKTFGQGIIAVVDVPCDPSECGGGSEGGSEGGSGGGGERQGGSEPAAASLAAPQCPAPPIARAAAVPGPDASAAAAGRVPAAVVTRTGGPGKRPAFRAPRAVAVPAVQPLQPPPLPGGPQQQQRRQFAAPATRPGAQLGGQPLAQTQPLAQHAAPAAGPAAAPVRSDDEILRLLMGEPLPPPAAATAGVAAGVGAAGVAAPAACSQEPEAKRQRLQPSARFVGAGLGEGMAQGAGLLGSRPAVAAAVAATSPPGRPARAAAKPRWAGFVSDEEEEEEAAEGGSLPGAWQGHQALASGQQPATSGAAQQGQGSKWQQHSQPQVPGAAMPGAGSKQGMAAGTSQVGWRQQPGFQQEQEEMQGSGAGGFGGAELDLSPASSPGTAGGSFRPIVKPAMAASLAPQPGSNAQRQQLGPSFLQQPPTQQQQQSGRQPQQRPPLQPAVQQQQQAGRLLPSGAGAGGAFRKPAVLAASGTAGKNSAAGCAMHAPATSTSSNSSWNSMVGGVVQLGWPTAEQCARPARQVAVPDSFSSSQQYVQVWVNALTEELNLRIAEVAQSFHTALSRFDQHPQGHSQALGGRGLAGGGRHGGAGGRGRGRGAGGADGSGMGGLEGQMRQCRVPYYGACELFIWKNLPKKGGWAGKRGKRGQEDCEEDRAAEEEVADEKPDSCYVILKSGRQKSAEYRKDDLWVIGNTPDLSCGLAAGQPGDRSHAPWVAVVRSLWHGPNQDGKFEVEFLSPRPPGLGRSTPVFAVKGPDASTELGMIDLLRSGAPATMPLLPHLLRAPSSGRMGAGASASSSLPAPHSLACAIPGAEQQQVGQSGGGPGSESPSYSCSDDDEALAAAVAAGGAGAAAADGLVESPLVQAEAFSRQFNLNLEQSEVLQYVAGWCSGQAASPGSAGRAGGGSKRARGGSVIRKAASMGAPAAQAAAAGAAGQPPPVCLVHGPFGSGKSTLLVALLHFLLQQRERQGSPLSGARVLVSAHTNVAVDRVLLGLLESGCTDFLRVGPLRRISRRLLPQSLHASESRATATAAAELREMLKDASSPAEQAAIRAELAAVERGADRQRRRLLKTIPIVGVTACSSLLSALDGQHFDVAILDESSQIVEPLSLVPLLRARARYLIAAGDPLQLPPVVASPSHVTPAHTLTQSRPPHQQHHNQQQQGQAQPHGLLRPLFVRLAALGLPPFLLRRQYRCHPDISAVPNQQFYGGRLVDGVSREQRASLVPGLPSLVFLDVRGQEQYNAGRSASNQQEAEAVVAAVERLLGAGVSLGQCGVICLFRAQVALVRSLLDRRMPALEQQQRRQREQAEELAGSGSSVEEQVLDDVDGEGQEQQQQGIQVATVDSFQGAECDVIILTTAVTRPGNFASDACRLNVALTRARRNLVIVGHAPALQQSSTAFAALLNRCRSMPGAYSSGRLPAGGGSGGRGGGIGSAGGSSARADRQQGELQSVQPMQLPCRGPMALQDAAAAAAAAATAVGVVRLQAGDELDGSDEEGWEAAAEAHSSRPVQRQHQQQREQQQYPQNHTLQQNAIQASHVAGGRRLQTSMA